SGQEASKVNGPRLVAPPPANGQTRTDGAGLLSERRGPVMKRLGAAGTSPGPPVPPFSDDPLDLAPGAGAPRRPGVPGLTRRSRTEVAVHWVDALPREGPRGIERSLMETQGPAIENANQASTPSQPQGISRRQLILTGGMAATAFTIVPRHVLGG